MGLLAFLGPIIGKALDLIPDPTQRAQQFQLIVQSLQEWDAQQNQVNQAEAQNPNLFVSGWRPWIGWGCGMALWYQYIIVPLAIWGTTWAGYSVPKPPTLDENLWQLMFGMLGMGGLRTFEKIKGVSK